MEPVEAQIKTLDQYFIDWESNAFGFGYGSGEEHILPLVKQFMFLIGVERDLPNSYDYRVLEQALGPIPTWFLINRFCAWDLDLINYGTSPRFGWLEDHGMRLKAYIDSKTAEELIDLTTQPHDPDYIECMPDACNCGPHGYQEGVKCPNPFWPRRR